MMSSPEIGVPALSTVAAAQDALSARTGVVYVTDSSMIPVVELPYPRTPMYSVLGVAPKTLSTVSSSGVSDERVQVVSLHAA